MISETQSNQEVSQNANPSLSKFKDFILEMELTGVKYGVFCIERVLLPPQVLKWYRGMFCRYK